MIEFVDPEYLHVDNYFITIGQKMKKLCQIYCFRVMAAHQNMPCMTQDKSFRQTDLIIGFVDPENLYADTYFITIGQKMKKLCQNKHFRVMAARNGQICVKYLTLGRQISKIIYSKVIKCIIGHK